MVAGALIAAAGVAAAETPMHARKDVELLARARAVYAITQMERQAGTETVERRVFDNNTVVYHALAETFMGGVRYRQESTLTLDEDSYFPRTLVSDKDIMQPADTVEIQYTVDMFSNLAAVGSRMGSRRDEKRLVVPSGVAVVEMGMLYPWYEMMYWVDSDTEARQRLRWLDPQKRVVEAGEIYRAGEELVSVLGKKQLVKVFKAARETMGEAKIWLDDQGRIVRLDQNQTLYELTEWSEDTAGEKP
jgi:hypothetical protein